MSDAVMLALIGVISTVLGVGSPLLLSILTSNQLARSKMAEAMENRLEKQQEYARLDVVAAKAEAAADAAAFKAAQVADQAAKAAQLLLASNKEVAKTAQITNGKLDVIHTLVNSSLTAAIQSEADAVTRELAMMLEVIELKRSMGKEPTQEAIVAIESTRKKIAELKMKLSDRFQQADAVTGQEKISQNEGIGIAREGAAHLE